jgi:Tfp pilus assembly protein PilF
VEPVREVQSPTSSSDPPTARDVGPASLPFEARDCVLIVPFENRTGEQILDGTLETALEQELANSAFVNVVPRDRIDDVLRLMQKPSDTKLDARLGREIAVRDGGVRALVTGRVERLGPTYVMTTQIANPHNGAVVRGLSDDAAGQAELLGTVRRQAFRVREALGEMLSTIRKSEASLEKVTTPSLRALQLYSQASAFMHGDNWKHEPAEQLLKDAINEDPGFASAHLLLAWAIRNQGRPRDEFLPYAKRAADLADRTNDIERYFIIGSYYDLASSDGDAIRPLPEEAKAPLRQAVAAYEALMQIKPDHYWGVNNLAFAYERLGQEAEATRWLLREADLRPSRLSSNFSAARSLLAAGKITPARGYVRRARALLTPEFRQDAYWAAQVEHFGAIIGWHDRDVGAVRRAVDNMARWVDGLQDGDATRLARRNILLRYVGLGRWRDAQKALQNVPPDDGGRLGGIISEKTTKGEMLWERAWLGDRDARESLRELAAASLSEQGGTNPHVLALPGMVDELREQVARAKQRAPAAFETLEGRRSSCCRREPNRRRDATVRGG